MSDLSGTTRRKDTGRPGNGGKYDHVAGSRSSANLDGPDAPMVALDDLGALIDTDARAAAMLAMSTDDPSVLDALTEALPDADASPAMVAIRQAIMTNPATMHDAKKHLLGTAPQDEAIAYIHDERIIDTDLLKNWIADGAAISRVEALARAEASDARVLGAIYYQDASRAYDAARAYAERRLINDIHGGTDLSDHPEPDVVHLFASVAGTEGRHGSHGEALERLATGEDPDLAYAVYLNPRAHVGIHTMAALGSLGATDDHDGIRDFFANPRVAPYSGLVVADIEKHGYHYATAGIASNPDLPEVQQLRLLAAIGPLAERNSGRNDIRLRLVSNPGVNPRVLATLTEAGNFREKDAAWRNPAMNTPEMLPVLERLVATTDFYSTLTEPETWKFDGLINGLRMKTTQR